VTAWAATRWHGQGDAAHVQGLKPRRQGRHAETASTDRRFRHSAYVFRKARLSTPAQVIEKAMRATHGGDSHLERDFDILLQHNQRLMQENESLRIELRRLAAGGVPIRAVERSLAPADGSADPSAANVSVDQGSDDSTYG
jgi:hypothetical protein